MLILLSCDRPGALFLNKQILTDFFLSDSTGLVKNQFRVGEEVFFHFTLTNATARPQDYYLPDTGPEVEFQVLKGDSVVGSSLDGLAFATVIVEGKLESGESLHQTERWFARPLHDLLPAGQYVTAARPRLHFSDLPSPVVEFIEFRVVCDSAAQECEIKPVNITDIPPADIQLHPFALNHLVIRGDFLTLDITYSGGCGKHEFDLVMTPAAFLESFPVQANLFLRHEDHDDACDGLVRREVTFNLQPVARLAEAFYGATDEIILNVFEYFEDQPGEKKSVRYFPK